MKLGFIGAGNMAAAIVRGVVSRGGVPAADIFLANHHPEKAERLARETGAVACASNREVAEKADVVFLSVKPHTIEPVLLDTREIILKGSKVLVSIAAGMPIETLERLTSRQTPIIRVMPNVNLTVGEGAAAVCGNNAATRREIDFVLDLFRSAGMAFEIAEKDFSIFSAIAGAAPAYAYLFIDALSRAGVKHGLSKELATKIAAQAVFGSAKMVAESDAVPWALIDRVCSPGGTTVAGLLAMEEANFTTSVIKGIDAVVAKDKELMLCNKATR